ncbi:hypothetical protein [Phyllobacterium myrsinacearum]|uniref:LysM domain-containing protein n=1 Tax=Phyllobacterium myrsinacearum TaxID=28101 RepID=A0A839EFZ1_9HYPH|nr:hypothetical protein [Phyllobacterium myrsinacearum]MBA8879073.1 hypothetical protein [Phyllobacterium myrsinacearum]
MAFPVDFYYRTRFSRENTQASISFDTAVTHAKKQHADKDRKHAKSADGVTIHQIKYGETSIQVGAGYGYKLEQLQLMNPGLRQDANVLVEGDTLTILDRELFDTVKASSDLTDEAVRADRSYTKMTNPSRDTPAHVRKLNAMEAPSVLQNADEKRKEAAALLMPGLLEAALPAGLDKAAMNQALDDHAKAIAPVGDDQPEFAKIVKDAKEGARSTMNEIFDRKVSFKDLASGGTREASLRELVADAKGTPAGSRRRDPSIEWQNVNRGVSALMRDLAAEATTGDKAAKKLAETQAVRNLSQIIAAATPNHDLSPEVDPFVSAVNSAANQVLVQSSVDAVNAAGNNKHADTRHSVPELQEMVAQTDGIDVALTAQRVQGATPALDTAMTDLFQQSIKFGSGAVMTDLTKVRSAMSDLTVLADRMATKEGEGEVSDLASSVVRVIDKVSEKSDESSKSVAFQIGTGLRESIADGQSPALAKEIARQLMDKDIVKSEHRSEASIILNLAGMGVEELKKNGTSTGKEFYEKVVYVSELGRENIGGSSSFSHTNGVASLLKSEKSLVERADRYGKAIVLTAAASRGLPKELQGLEGAERFENAGNDIRDGLDKDVVTGKGKDAEINFLPLLRQYSPGGALSSQQIAADQARVRLQDLPGQDLDKLIDELGRLPADDPYNELVKQLKSLDDPKAALYDSPELTLALMERFSQPDGARPKEDAGPSAGFLSRTGRDVLLEVFAFQTQAGGGLIPGTNPIQPTSGVRLDAMDRSLNAAERRLKADAQWIAARYEPKGAIRNGFSALRDTARDVWLAANPVRTLEARTGVAAYAPAIPFVSTGSALLNIWGTVSLTAPGTSPMDKAWGYYFGIGATRDMALAVDGTRSIFWKAGFSQIKGMRGWEWLPRAYNGLGAGLSVAQLGYELGRGDLPMAAAWAPGTAASIYAALPNAVAAGPVVTIGFLLTAGLVTGIGQYRHVKDSNHLEGPLGAYWRGAAPDVDKPESLANCDESAVPYLALNPEIAKAQGVSPEIMIDYLYNLDPGKRDVLIDRALQVKPNGEGEFPVKSKPGETKRGVSDENGIMIDPRIQRSQIGTIEDFRTWTKDWGYSLPSRS